MVRAHESTIGEAERFEIKQAQGDAVYLYNVGAACHVNHRFGFVVREDPLRVPTYHPPTSRMLYKYFACAWQLRGHGNKPGRPAGKLASARLSFRYFDLAQLRTAYAEAAAKELAMRKPIAEQLSKIRSLASSNEVRVISYGLYGADTRYTHGVVRNAQLAPLVYPGWKVNAFSTHASPQHLLKPSAE